MNEILPDDGHTVEHYPRIRHATRDLLNAAARKHMIHAMVEVDVTAARFLSRMRRELERGANLVGGGQ